MLPTVPPDRSLDEKLRELQRRPNTAFLSRFSSRPIVSNPAVAKPPAPTSVPAPLPSAAPVTGALIPNAPFEQDPMAWMRASVASGTIGAAAPNRIERKEKNPEAIARPVSLEHRQKVSADSQKARQAWLARLPPPPPPLPPPPPPPADAAVAAAPPPEPAPKEDEEMKQAEVLAPAPPPFPAAVAANRGPVVGDQKMVLGDCLDPGIKNRCFHEVAVKTYESKGWVTSESHGLVAGCYIVALAGVLRLSVPTQWEAHLNEQSRANVDRLQQSYRKAERKTKPGSKRKKPSAGTVAASASAAGTGGGGGGGASKASFFGKLSLKPQKRKSKTGIGGRRSGTSTSKHRLKTFVRVLARFRLMSRNSVHKGTAVPVHDMYELRDTGVGAYHPLTFPAVQFRTPDPHGTVSEMESGELSISSAPSEDEALILAIQQITLNLLQFNMPAILENFGAANITASAGLGWAIDLDKLVAFLANHPNKKSTTFDRSMFPGLHWTLIEPKGVVLGFFELGFVNAVGLKEERHFKLVRDVILPEINANREQLENKAKSAQVLMMDTNNKEYEELCKVADETMEIHQQRAEEAAGMD